MGKDDSLDPWWMLLLREQQATGFADVAGTQVSATLPVSDRLVTRVARARLPPAAPVRELDVRAHPAGRLSVHLRLSRPAFLPPFTLSITMLRQPELPRSPVFVFRVDSPGGLLKLAGPLVRRMDALPPGVSLAGDRLSVDIRKALEASGAALALELLEHFEIGTAEGHVILSLRARVPAPCADPGSAEL